MAQIDRAFFSSMSVTIGVIFDVSSNIEFGFKVISSGKVLVKPFSLPHFSADHVAYCDANCFGTIWIKTLVYELV